MLFEDVITVIAFSVLATAFFLKLAEKLHNNSSIISNDNRLEYNFIELFPSDILSFKGNKITRGMTIKFITTSNKKFEGEFIGLNDDDYICISTKNHFISQKLDAIEKLYKI